MTDLARVGARGGVVAIVTQAVTMAARLVSVILLARWIAPEYFGLVAIVVSLSDIAVAIIGLGLPMAVAQAPGLSHRARSSLFAVNAGLGVVFALAFFLGADAIAALYDEPRIVPLTRWLALVPLLAGLTAQFRGQLMVDLKAASSQAIVAATRVIGVGAAVAFAAATGSPYALVVLAVVPQALQLPWLAFAARWWPGLPGEWREAGGLIRVGAHIFGLTMVRSLTRSILVPVMGLFQPAAMVGQYDRASQLSATPVNSLTDGLQQVAIPLLARVRDDRARMMRAFDSLQVAIVMSMVSAMWLAAAIGEPLVVVLLGPDWQVAGVVFQLVTIGAGFRLVATVQQWLFIAGEATAAGLRFSLWSQPAVVALSLAGLPWGVVGVSVMNAVAWLVFWPVGAVFAGRAVGVSARSVLGGTAYATALFAAPIAIAAALPRLWVDGNVPQILAGTAAGLAVAGLMLALNGRLRRTFMRFVRQVAGSLRRSASAAG
ncbi:oligosaccharide flippase family protein [Demequina subtropica]|uniref:oligosaccharide flippase family protein n=1 Tax=Demequina subtropica TaxID=1638989 RepID=UPI0007806411|nr:oligosaccharide flippase family protein [Demequina subtropica]